MDATNMVTVHVLVNAPIDKVWDFWIDPRHIVNWNFASSDWHTPQATNDVREGGSFSYFMEAKDGSMGFDFEGIYKHVDKSNRLVYTLGDGREVSIDFVDIDGKTEVIESFEAEKTNPVDMQRKGWQAILNNFKRYVEDDF
jgi:uncharacterized protein YndB with AHSA1/START domain